MKTKQSKGEWWACCLDSKPHFVFAGENKVVCAIRHNDPKDENYEILEEIVTVEECVANAKLIASAPELLDALVIMTSLCRLSYGNLDKDIYSEILKAEAIIKKATE